MTILQEDFRFELAATFSVIISSKNYEDILEERNQGECPENKRKNSKDLFISLCVFNVLCKRALVHIQRRDAQVPIDHPKALICQQQETLPRFLLLSGRNKQSNNNLITRTHDIIICQIMSQTLQELQQLPVSRSMLQTGR